MTELAITQATHAPEPSHEPFLVPVLTGHRRAEYLFSAAVWACAFAYFWIWWLEPRHHVDAFGTITVSLVLAWVTALPAYFIVVFYRAARPNGPLRLPAGSRVAMVVTKAPAEPFSVVSETLLAMLAQEVEHDTWLADEDPSPRLLTGAPSTGSSSRPARGDPIIIARRGPDARGARKATSPSSTTTTATAATISWRNSMQIMCPRPTISSTCCVRSPIQRSAMSRPPAFATRTLLKAGRHVEGSMPRPACMVRSKPVTMAAWRRCA